MAFATAHEWVKRLSSAKRAGRLDDELERLGRLPLLVVDEVGCAPRGAESSRGVERPARDRRSGRKKLRAA